MALLRRLDWLVSHVPRHQARAEFANLMAVGDLPGGGWKQLDERAWRTGVSRKTQPWAQRACRAGCLTVWRSFEQAATQRWMWVQTTAVASGADALAATGAVPRSGLANLRADLHVVSVTDVDAPKIERAVRTSAPETITSGTRSTGIALQLAFPLDSVVVVIACSGLAGSWQRTDIALLAERQAALVGRDAV